MFLFLLRFSILPLQAKALNLLEYLTKPSPPQKAPADLRISPTVFLSQIRFFPRTLWRKLSVWDLKSCDPGHQGGLRAAAELVPTPGAHPVLPEGTAPGRGLGKFCFVTGQLTTTRCSSIKRNHQPGYLSSVFQRGILSCVFNPCWVLFTDILNCELHVTVLYCRI